MESAWSLDGWYFRRGDALLGPVTTGELQQLVTGGQLGATDTIWGGWHRSSDRLLVPTIVHAVLGLTVPFAPASDR